ncbi:MAG: rhomboid family intrarane serine protease [Bacteroidetes bacterium]|nr:rhomboid family intrarane serine protease [Bacteroidota bacterium]
MVGHEATIPIMNSKTEENIDIRRFRISLLFPTFLLIVLWLIKIVEQAENWDLSFLGVFPRRASGLLGILTAPFIHANFNHLINNSVPLFVLSLAIFFFYHKVAFRVHLYAWLITGIAVWLFARPSHHIGASGLIYAFASFLFFSGIIRQNINLLAISLLVAFLYGSMVWGIFPYKPDMSWESHLMGMMVGLGLALYYRNEGPVIPKHVWEEEEEEATETIVETDVEGQQAGDGNQEGRKTG